MSLPSVAFVTEERLRFLKSLRSEKKKEIDLGVFPNKTDEAYTGNYADQMGERTPLSSDIAS